MNNDKFSIISLINQYDYQNRQTLKHDVGLNEILNLADTSLYSYADETTDSYIENGLSLTSKNERYFKNKCIIYESLYGDLISSIKCLSDECKKLKKNETDLTERINTLEDNLRAIRNKFNF